MQSLTPFYDAIHRLSVSEGRFHVPGHKGDASAIPFMGAALRYDITEIPGADDLQNPTGPLLQSQQNMARAYGSGATLYSAFGSTSCIEAMLTLYLAPGDTVVLARNCHVSAVRALGFIGANPHWVLPRAGAPLPGDIDAALAQSGAQAVYITSPDYYGRVADVAAIASVCHSHGAALLVDNAHGAHLRFLQPDIHPLTLGADAVAESAHKTLPCITGAALLHLRDGGLAGDARRALNLYSSTSPGYLVLLSLDLAAGMLLQSPPDFARAAAQLAEAAWAAPHMVLPGGDPLKLCICPSLAAVPYAEVKAALAQNDIVPELCDSTRMVFMASPFNPARSFQRLAGVLGGFPARGKGAPPDEGLRLPQPECTVREAMYAAQQRVPVQNAVGRIAAEVAAPCPPGIPVVVPGERVQPEHADRLASGGILALNVVK